MNQWLLNPLWGMQRAKNSIAWLSFRTSWKRVTSWLATTDTMETTACSQLPLWVRLGCVSTPSSSKCYKLVGRSTTPGLLRRPKKSGPSVPHRWRCSLFQLRGTLAIACSFFSGTSLREGPATSYLKNHSPSNPKPKVQTQTLPRPSNHVTQSRECLIHSCSSSSSSSRRRRRRRRRRPPPTTTTTTTTTDPACPQCTKLR